MANEAQDQAAELGGSYVSKYDGEEIDALLDSIAKLRQDVDKLAAAQGVTL